MKRLALFALLLLMAASGQSVWSAQNGSTQAPNSATAPGASIPPASTGATQTTETPAATASATLPKIDPAKEADIRRLLDVTGAATLARQVMDNMEQSIKPLMTDALPPGDYRDTLVELFFQKFQSKINGNSLIDLAVVRYDENFSDEEIKQLISFYQTPLGQKVTTMLPKLTGELQQDGEKMGQQLGRESMIEVLQEHPELARALQEAAQKRALQGQP